MTHDSYQYLSENGCIQEFYLTRLHTKKKNMYTGPFKNVQSNLFLLFGAKEREALHKYNTLFSMSIRNNI